MPSWTVVLLTALAGHAGLDQVGDGFAARGTAFSPTLKAVAKRTLSCTPAHTPLINTSALSADVCSVCTAGRALWVEEFEAGMVTLLKPMHRL